MTDMHVPARLSEVGGEQYHTFSTRRQQLAQLRQFSSKRISAEKIPIPS
jgi:hypothetical protein